MGWPVKPLRSRDDLVTALTGGGPGAYLSAREAAVVLMIAPNTAYRMIADGRLTARRNGAGRVAVDPSSLTAWITTTCPHLLPDVVRTSGHAS